MFSASSFAQDPFSTYSHIFKSGQADFVLTLDMEATTTLRGFSATKDWIIPSQLMTWSLPSAPEEWKQPKSSYVWTLPK